MKSHIQDPVQAVFDSPMTAFSRQDSAGVIREAGDKEVGGVGLPRRRNEPGLMLLHSALKTVPSARRHNP